MYRIICRASDHQAFLFGLKPVVSLSSPSCSDTAGVWIFEKDIRVPQDDHSVDVFKCEDAVAITVLHFTEVVITFDTAQIAAAWGKAREWTPTNSGPFLVQSTLSLLRYKASSSAWMPAGLPTIPEKFPHHAMGGAANALRDRNKIQKTA